MVMDRMGHAQIQTTQKYLHALPDADQKNLDALTRIADQRDDPAAPGSRNTDCADKQKIPSALALPRHSGSLLLSTGASEGLLRRVFRGGGGGVASLSRVREVADPKCRCAGAGRPRWI